MFVTCCFVSLYAFRLIVGLVLSTFVYWYLDTLPGLAVVASCVCLYALIVAITIQVADANLDVFLRGLIAEGQGGSKARPCG